MIVTKKTRREQAKFELAMLDILKAGLRERGIKSYAICLGFDWNEHGELYVNVPEPIKGI